MQKLLFLILALPIFAKEPLTKPLPTAKPETLGMSTEALAKIDPAVEKLISENKLAGASVLVLRKGHIVYQNQFGHRNRALKRPVEKDTIFRIYSMTKAITSAAALMLHDDGKLDLDAPLHQYIPEFKNLKVWNKGKEVALTRPPTTRDLLRHTAGFSYGWGANRVDQLYKKRKPIDRSKTLAEMATALSQTPLLYQPGSQWVYGVNTDVLGRVIEVASGKPLDQFFQERLFTPLHMPDTAFHVPAGKRKRFSVCYGGKAGILAVIEPILGSPFLKKPAHLSGGGGLVSTINDYARFLQMIANGGTFQGKTYLKKETVKLMTTNQLPKEIPAISFGSEKRHGTAFGLGFSVRTAVSKRWDPHAPIGEYGWGGAASTHYWISPKDELIVIAMEQTMPYNWNLEKALKPIIYNALKK